jgi:7-carboxy-7-deazaguanine synthase
MYETKATVSELFISIEGEAKYTGYPTVYVRFTGCNFQCKGFNNPYNVEITNNVLGFNPADISSLADVPPITIGCDSIYSWDQRFKHMWTTYTIDELANALVDLLPHKQWFHPNTKHPYILSLTGGEPTLRHKQINALLKHPLMQDVKILLIETNGSVPLHESLLTTLYHWLAQVEDRKVVWSNSPKLSASGENWDRAINPTVINQQLLFGRPDVEQYFKFVCGDSDRDFEEVEKALAVYERYHVDTAGKVYIMPMSCIEEQQVYIAERVAKRCIESGYIYCHRVHLSVFGNSIGT